MADKPPGDKTEAPTQKRQDDARKKGEVARSKELGPAVVTLAAATWLLLYGGDFVSAFANALSVGLVIGPGDIADFAPMARAEAIVGTLVRPLGGFALVTIAAALVGGGLLGGASFNWGQAAPKPSRLDPIAGLGRMFGAHGLTELGKALLKVLVVGAIASWAILSLGRDLVGLARADPAVAIAHAGDRARWLFLMLGGGLALIAAVDAPVALIRHLAKLRMTKQEVRDEVKEQEGSAEVKGQQRRRMREAARGGAAKAVATAQVVLTNPEHYAVALRYRRAEDPAPVVVARGRGEIARAIRAAAREHGIPALEYPLLARALYFTGKPGREIHPDLYVAVAAILAFVFTLDRTSRARAPEIEVPAGQRFDEQGRRIA